MKMRGCGETKNWGFGVEGICGYGDVTKIEDGKL
jgi:hypothetical protein